jgi:AraC-like DNA-binding protein
MARIAQTCQKLLPALSPRLVYVDRIAANPQWRMPAHCHRHDEVIVLLRGCLRATVDGVPLVGCAGDILLYPAGKVHAEFSDPIDPLESIHIGAYAHGAISVPRVLADSRGRVRQLAHWIYEDRYTTVSSARSATHALLISLLSELQRILDQPAEEANLIASTRAYIWRHITEKLTLDRLAQHADLSKFHFSRLYRRLVQQTPAADVREMRTSYACDLLLVSNLPLKAIASKVGFTDEYQLSRLVRKRHRLSPGALRRRLRGQ